MERMQNQRLGESTHYWRGEKPLTTQHYLVVSLLLLTLLVLTFSMPAAPQLGLEDTGTLFFLFMFSLSLLLNVRLTQGIYVGAYIMVQIACAFTLGFQATLLLTLLAAAISLPLRLVIGLLRGMSWQDASKQAVETIADATVAPLTLVLVAQIFPNTIHGTADMANMALADPSSVMATVMVFGMIFLVFCLFWLSLSITNIHSYIRRHWPALLGHGAILMIFGPILAATFTTMEASLFVTSATFILLIVLVGAFFRLYVHQTYHKMLLEVVEQLDTDLLTANSVYHVAVAAHTAIDELVEASNFQIAVFDDVERVLEFPLVFRNGIALKLSERAYSRGFNEHVIERKKPLIINRNALEVAQSGGFKPDRATDIGLEKWYSLLAVPLIAEDKVIGVVSVRNHQPGYQYFQQHLNAVQIIARRISVAVAKTQLLERTQRHAEELQSVTEVSSLVGANLDLEQLIASVCRIVIDLFHAQKAAVFLVDNAASSVELAGSVGLTERFIRQSKSVSIDAPRMQAIATGKPVLLEDIDITEITQIGSLDKYIRALIDVPLKLEGKVIGALTAYYTHPNRFTDHTVRLAETMANQLAVAVKNAGLFEAERARQRQLEALYTASTRLATSLSLRSVLDATVSSIVEALDAEICGAMLLDEDERLLEPSVLIRRSNGLSNYSQAEQGHFELSKMPVVEQALAKARLTTIRTDQELSTQEQQLLDSYDLKSMMIVPLIVHQFQIGIVFAGSSQLTKQYDEERLKQMQLLLNQAAVALQNARLFETIDVALTSRMNELEALGRIAQRMTSQLSISEVLEQVVKAAAEATGSDMCELILFDEQEQILRVVASLQGLDSLTITEWPADEGLSGYALEIGQTVIVDDMHQDNRALVARPHAHSEIVTPILLDKKKLGVINVESAEVGAFNQSHARFLNHLAEHAAIAIQNARLFETIHQRAEEFNALRGLGVQLLSAASLKQTLRLIIEEAKQRVDAANVYVFLEQQESDGSQTSFSLLETGEVKMDEYFPAAERLRQEIGTTEQPIIAPDVRQNHLFEDFLPLLEKQNIGGAVCLPLRRGESLIGTFIATFGSETSISDDVLRFLDLLASQASVAIANEQLSELTREGRDRLQAILHSINDGIVMIDRTGKVTLANTRAEYLLNVHLNNYIGETFADIFEKISVDHEEAGFLAINEIRDIEQTARENPNIITRRTYELHSPSFRALQEISSPVTNEKGNILGRLFVIRDVTQQVMLDQYQKEMSEMIVHDLRAPLSGVISSIYFALEEAEGETGNERLDTITTALNIALASSDSLLQLIEAILDINKLEAGEMQLDLELQKIDVVISRVLDTLSSRIEQANLSVISNIPDDLPLVDIDQQTIERVFNNLLDNAIRHTPEGGVIHVQVSKQDTHLRVLVEDSGRGIEPDMREKIFERFMQSDRSQRYRGSKGSGLGLTFCRLAVDAHGGRIWVEEGVRGGAAFYFTLPLSPEKPAPTE